MAAVKGEPKGAVAATGKWLLLQWQQVPAVEAGAGAGALVGAGDVAGEAQRQLGREGMQSRLSRGSR